MNSMLQDVPTWVGEYRLDLAAQRLWRDGEAVDLVPQVWALLMCLLERPGALRSKDEILRSAWPGVAVSDMALSQAVRRLRTALGDDPRAPRYLETVPRRGFRFIAPLRTQARPMSVRAPESTLFVGREAERGTLAELLAAARGGARQLVFIEGGPGIGKTALVNAFLAEHAAGGLIVIRAQCVEQEGSVEPYLVVLEALDQLVRSEPRTVDVLRRHAPTWLAQIPWLLSTPGGPQAEEAVGDATHARMLREMAHALEVLAAERPVLVILDDLHWADTATIDLLGSIAQRTERACLMVVGTYQTARAIACGKPIVDVVRRLWTRGVCARLGLELFERAEVQAFLARRLCSPELAVALAERLHTHSEGNPLFLVTMVDHLIARGLVTAGITAGGSTERIGDEDLRNIPPNLRGMIELYLDSVGAAELEVLEAASAAALEFRTASVAAALGMPGPEGIETVERRCERLVERWHVLCEAGVETWPDGTRTSRYAFRHDLYRQVLYERLAGARCRRFHQRIGERLEQGFPGNSSRVAAEMAAHFDRSGEATKAATYFIQAAHQARRRFAEREAATHFRAALRCVDELPPAPGRDLEELTARLGLVRARLLSKLQRPDDEEHHLARIEALAARLDGRDFFRLQAALAHIYLLRSRPRLAGPIADRMVELGADGEPAQQMEAYFARGTTAMMQGHFVAALEDISRAHASHGDGAPNATTGFSGYQKRWREVGIRIHANLGSLLLLTGRANHALGHLQRAIALCAEPIHPNHAAGGLLTVAGTLCLRGDLKRAQTISDRGLAIAEEHSLMSLIAAAAPQRLWLSMKQGERHGWLGRIRVAWEQYLRARDSAVAPVGPLFVVDAYRIAGAADEGLAIAEKVWHDTRASGLRWYDAELQRLRGELIQLQGARGARAKAAACFQHALEIAREQGARFHELRAATSLAHLCRGGPNERSARTTLERVYTGFTEGFATPDLRAAAACLRSNPKARAFRLRVGRAAADDVGSRTLEPVTARPSRRPTPEPDAPRRWQRVPSAS